MANSIDEFKRLLETELPGLSGVAVIEDIQKAVDAEVQRLVDAGVLSIGPDHRLTGRALEVRVFALLRKMGITVEPGPPGFWDAVLILAGTEPRKACALEIKSSKDAAPGRTELRQLDDWVFELSGEENARKHGLGGGIDPRAIATMGIRTSRRFHPTPHKGVMIFNGPLGLEFNARPRDWLGANEKIFADKRDFAVVSLATLLAWHDRITIDAAALATFWQLLHSTAGVLQGPET